MGIKGKDDRIKNQTFACWVWLVCFCLPASLLFNFLAFNQYTPFSPEVMIIFLALAAFSLAAAGLAWRVRPAGVFLVALILLCYLYAVIPVDRIYEGLENPSAQNIVKFGVGAIALITGFVLINRLGATAWRGLTLASLVILSSTAVTWWTSDPYPRIRTLEEPAAAASSDLPPLLYIIFDEHMSVKWTPENLPNAQAAKQAMLDFYGKFDFLLFTNAFSHYFDTAPSISNALNFSAEHTAVGFDKTAQGKKLARNAVFERLKKAGYRIRVYQNQYIDFCDGSDEGIEFCLESGNNYIGDLREADIPTGQKSLLLIGHWLRSFKFGRSIVAESQKGLAAFIGEDMRRVSILGSPYNRVGPINVMPAMESLREDMDRQPRGRAFFAHFLIPHYPYVLDDQCAVKKDPRQWLGPSRWYHNQNPPSRSEQYEHYYDQVRCLYRWLDDWFDELREDGRFQDMQVIFHGDHGSRICPADPSVATLSHPEWDRIVKDGFSTLFAVKDPKITPGRIETAKPIDTLLEELFVEPEKLTSARPDLDFLFLKSKGKKLEKHAYHQW